MDYILVTGGLGFIGSHIVVELIENGNNVIIIDNLSNSNLNVFFTLLEMTDKTRKQNKNTLLCFKNDICDIESLDKIFKLHHISGIIHLAAHKAVNESIQLPLQYYENNIGSTITLLKLCNKYKVSHFIFSSSATVYGNSTSPLSESSTVGINIGSPYGRTKFFIEQILYDFYQSNPETKVVILRYFNPVGAHVSGKIGENPNGIPNNLMPFLLRVAIKNNLDSSYDDTYEPSLQANEDYIDTSDTPTLYGSNIEVSNKSSETDMRKQRMETEYVKRFMIMKNLADVFYAQSEQDNREITPDSDSDEMDQVLSVQDFLTLSNTEVCIIYTYFLIYCLCYINMNICLLFFLSFFLCCL